MDFSNRNYFIIFVIVTIQWEKPHDVTALHCHDVRRGGHLLVMGCAEWHRLSLITAQTTLLSRKNKNRKKKTSKSTCLFVQEIQHVYSLKS